MKRIVLIALALVLVFELVACGDIGSPDRSTPSTDTSAETAPADVNWWGEYRDGDLTLSITNYDQNPQGDWHFSYFLDSEEESAQGTAVITTKDFREAKIGDQTFTFNPDGSITIRGVSIMFDGDYKRYDDTVVWSGIYEGDGYVVEISEEDRRKVYFMVKPITTTVLDAVSRNPAVLEAWAFYKDDANVTVDNDFGLHLYKDGESTMLDLLSSESSEWAYLRGQYKKIDC